MGEFQRRIERIQKLKPEALQALLFENEDRGTAIMATGLLEDLLTLAIIHKFKKQPSETQATELFTGFGPFATLSAKTRVAFLLGILPPDAKHDINTIRRIRNDFAHVIAPLTFETQDIAIRCRSLKLKALLTDAIDERAGIGPKGHFIRSTVKIFALLLMDICISALEKQILRERHEEVSKLVKEEFGKWVKFLPAKPSASS